jgi:hypothetical protein
VSVFSVLMRAARDFGEDLWSEVAASFGRFVVLLGRDGTDEPDDRATAGEDADDVGAAADLSVEPLGGVVGARPVWEGGEDEDVGAGFLEVLGHG